jgi:hypothetical protein
MIKNGIISLLLIVILNMMPGDWAVEGFRKFLLNTGLFICLFYIISDGEVLIKRGIKKYIRRRRNNE